MTRRNIEIQLYSSHSIHVLVLNGSTDTVKDISEFGIKVDYNINVLKDLLSSFIFFVKWSNSVFEPKKNHALSPIVRGQYTLIIRNIYIKDFLFI